VFGPCNKTRPGFSLTELVFAMAILGLMVAIAIPNLFKRKPLYEQKAFVTSLNAFMAEAWQRGLTTQKIQKIVFDIPQRKVFLEQETNHQDPQGNPQFAPVVVQYAPAAPSWPETFEIQQFFVQGADELSSRTSTKHTVWFFVLPGGLAQEVIINMVDIKTQTDLDDGKKIGLVLNPFTVQFKMYDEFQSPA
jgi:prepilin-type N-terminal cleavage/methylation domain-containing protein